MLTEDFEDLGPGPQQIGMAKSSGLARGPSGRSIDLLAHSTSSAHMRRP